MQDNILNKYKNATSFDVCGIYDCYVVKCIDGDTFDGSICYSKEKDIYFKLRMRLYGCDAYETHIKKKQDGHNITNREELRTMGNKAKARLRELIENKMIKLSIENKDKYGRYIANIMQVNDIDVDISNQLIKEGLAFAYSGEGIKEQSTKYET